VQAAWTSAYTLLADTMRAVAPEVAEDVQEEALVV